MPARHVRLRGPLDLRATLAPLRMGRGDPTLRLGPSVAWRASHTPEGPAAGRYRLEDDRVEVTAWGPGAPFLLETAPRLAGAADDPGALVPRDTVVSRLVRHTPGLRLPATTTAFEVLVGAILSQKVTGLEAKRAWRRLVHRHSEPAPGPVGTELYLPPSPQALATLPLHEYHRAGVERRRAQTIRFAASRVARVEEAGTMSREDARERLGAFPGIGAWTVANVMRLAYGDPDAVEVGDFHLPDIVAWNLAGEARGDDRRMLELLAPYAGQRGRVVRLVETSGSYPPRFGPRFAPRGIEHL